VANTFFNTVNKILYLNTAGLDDIIKKNMQKWEGMWENDINAA